MNGFAIPDQSGISRFCTIAGSKYVLKVMALYDSLSKHAGPFRLWVCCVDEGAYAALRACRFESMILVQAAELESRDPRLARVRAERQLNEYCWTLKAPLVEYLLTVHGLPDMLYCDGDLYFFHRPDALFREWGTAPVYVCPQRDLDWVEAKYGKYQAGLIGFRNTPQGLQALRWWQARCIEWCFGVASEGRFGDQKYLDQLPHMAGVKVSANTGINAAPWNAVYSRQFPISKRGNHLAIGDDNLVVFHFACITIYEYDEFDLWNLDQLYIPPMLMNEIYIPYLDAIGKAADTLYRIDARLYHMTLADSDRTLAKSFYKYSPLRREMDQWGKFYHLCTIVSTEFVPKVVTLYQSLKEKIGHFHLWICCVDDGALNALRAVPMDNATLITPEEFETPQLRKARSARRLHEYCWTLKAPLCRYLLDSQLELDSIVYCDADMYFFASPEPLYEEWAKYSIFLCPQRGTGELESQYGQYQAGLIGFKREANSLRILDWWKDRCLEWCFDTHETSDTIWGDQKYLNRIPQLFGNIKLIDNPGIDAAPWNVVMNQGKFKVSKQGRQLRINNRPLIAYHFGSLAIMNRDTYDLWRRESLPFRSDIVEMIYRPYLDSLRGTFDLLKGVADLEPSQFYARLPVPYFPKNLYSY